MCTLMVMRKTLKLNRRRQLCELAIFLELEVNVPPIGRNIYYFSKLLVANSSVGNLKANLHRLGISEGSDSGCMSTMSEEMAPDEETERLEISKYDKFEFVSLRFVSRNYCSEIDQQLPAIMLTH